MKDYKKLNGILSSGAMLAVAFLISQTAVAGSYNSSVHLPTLHSKGYV